LPWLADPFDQVRLELRTSRRIGERDDRVPRADDFIDPWVEDPAPTLRTQGKKDAIPDCAGAGR
jgi:hypothetical protein